MSFQASLESRTTVLYIFFFLMFLYRENFFPQLSFNFFSSRIIFSSSGGPGLSRLILTPESHLINLEKKLIYYDIPH